jgi:3-isopropylmalate/(R)-2-methylmalate dehydratase small subunit
MTPIRSVTSLAIPLLRDNVDTDAIIPSREMKSTGKTGFAEGLFAGWRYIDPASREQNPDFVLNRPEYRGARILLAGANFGSGSSREHAVWALKEYGIQAIVAASFAPIFRNNCIRNGIVPAAIEREAVEAIAGSGLPVTVSVEARQVSLPSGQARDFPLDEEARLMLLEGLDAIDLTLKHGEAIAAWQRQDRERRPWIYLGAPS